MKQVIHSDNAPKAIGPYSHAISAGGFVFTSGQIGLDPLTGKLLQGIEEQTKQALDNLEAVLGSAGVSFDDVVKTTVFVQDLKDFAAVNKIYGERLGENRPARSCVQVAALPAGGLVEIEAIAALD
jgi:2-iminobutanoate/2-iminopropanoate deaminase